MTTKLLNVSARVEEVEYSRLDESEIKQRSLINEDHGLENVLDKTNLCKSCAVR